MAEFQIDNSANVNPIIVGALSRHTTKENIDEKSFDIEEKDEKSITDHLSEEVDAESEEYRDIPLLVREMVNFNDEEEGQSGISFRFFILSFFFTGLGALVSQIAYFRTTSAPYTSFFVQIVTFWLGPLLARIIPSYQVGRGRFSFNTNPGPWKLKEHVLVTLTASAGGNANFAEVVVVVKDLYWGQRMNPLAAMFLMWSTIGIGYSYAGFARHFVLYDPEFVWQNSLMNANLFKTMYENKKADAKTAKRQMRWFWIVLVGMFCWEFLPAYMMPMLSSLSIICWAAGHRSPAASFVGGGIGGMGFLNITLDWSNITSSVVLSPWWSQVLQFSGYALSAWILIPLFYFGRLGSTDVYPIMTNKIYLKNGTLYPYRALVLPNGQFNETAYAIYGLPRISAQSLWYNWFFYASFVSAFVFIGLTRGPKIYGVVKNILLRRKEVRKDKLNKMMEQYGPNGDIPGWWFGIVFIISLGVFFALVYTEDLYLPWYTVIVGLIIGGITLIPMAWIYSISNYTTQLGIINELFYGYMINAKGASRHPVGSLVYRVLSGDCWYKAQTMLQDQKMGLYMHINMREVFFTQMWGVLIGVPINVGVIRWVIDTKRSYLDQTEVDPAGQWSGQDALNYNTEAVEYALIGPARLYASGFYTPLLYGFLAGAVVPVFVWLLHKKWPHKGIDLLNPTIFFASAAQFRGFLSTGPFTKVILGVFINFYLMRYKHRIWKAYAFLLGAAADAGWNLNLLFIFVAFSAGKSIKMPNYFFNNAESVDRCFGKKKFW